MCWTPQGPYTFEFVDGKLEKITYINGPTVQRSSYVVVTTEFSLEDAWLDMQAKFTHEMASWTIEEFFRKNGDGPHKIVMDI